MKNFLLTGRWLCYALTGLLSTTQVTAQSIGAGNQIYHQSSDYSAGYYAESGMKVLHADVNNDGIRDVIVTGRYSMDLLIFKANGEFRRQPINTGYYTGGSFGSSVAADLNNDGHIDFAWYDEWNTDIIVTYWTANSTQGNPEYSMPQPMQLAGLFELYWETYMGMYGLNAADIDGDGDMDLVGFGPNGSIRPHMILNDGNGHFVRYDLHDVPMYQAMSRIVDMNGDGKLDILVSSVSSIDLYTNTGNSGDPSIPVFTHSVVFDNTVLPRYDGVMGAFDLADFDQDGKLDILVNYLAYDPFQHSYRCMTNLLINRTINAPDYQYVANTLLEAPYLYTNEHIGGYGSRYMDVDNNGTLDIIGNRGGYNKNEADKLSLTKLLIDASGHVTISESTLLEYNSLDANRSQGLNLVYDDLDGDNKMDFLYSTTHQGLLYRKSTFPARKSASQVVEFVNSVFIGGDRNDDIELTITTTDPNAKLYFSPNSQAQMDGAGTNTMTITGKVTDVNANLGWGNVNFSAEGNYTVTFTVKNLTTQAVTTNTEKLVIAPPTFYPKPGQEAYLHDFNNWSDAVDGSGAVPDGFNAGYHFIFSNSTGATEFSGGDFHYIQSNITIPKNAVLTLNHMFMVQGRLDMKGEIKGQGRLSLQGQQPVNLHGKVNVAQLELYSDADISIKGRLSVSDYADLGYGTLKIDSGSVYFQGYVNINTGRIDAATGEVRLQGSGHAVHPSWFSGPVQKLTVDGDDVSYVSDNLMVDTLNFEKGLLLLSNSQVAAKVIVGGNAQSYAMAQFGALKMRLDEGQIAKFPVGTNYYNPVTITNHTGASDVFTVLSLHEGWGTELYQKLNPESRVHHVWEIEKANPNEGNGIDITLGWDAAQEHQMGLPGLYHFENTDWVEVADGTITRAPRQLTFKGYKGTFSPFGVMSSFITLPVTYQRLEAKAVKATAVIEWKTSNESNTRDFEVQRSVDGLNWTTIGTVAAKNIATGGNYQFVDHQPVMGTNLYRLNQRDKDGKSNLSKTLTVAFVAAQEGFKAYPNPVKDGLLSLQVKKPGMLTVYSAAGVQLVQTNLSAGTHQLNTGNWAKGVYTLMFNNEAKRVVIQ